MADAMTTERAREALAEMLEFRRDVVPKVLDQDPSALEKARSQVAALTLALNALDAVVRVEAACDEVARDNLHETLAPDQPDPNCGRWVVQDEDGVPLLNANDPAEVVRELSGLWDRVGEELESALYVLRRLAPMHNAALARVDALMAGDPAADSADGRELSALADAVQAYEAWRFPIRALDGEVPR